MKPWHHLDYFSLFPFIPIHEKVWQEISVDFIEGLPKTPEKGITYVKVDRLRKAAHFMALKHPYSALDVAQLFVDSIFRLHGMPKTIVFRQGPCVP